VQPADEFGVFLSQIRERAVGERDHRGTVIIFGTIRLGIGDDRVEPEPIQVGHERFERRRSILVTPSSGTALVETDGNSIVTTRLKAFCDRQHHPCQHGHRWRLKTEGRCVRRDGIAMLRASDVTTTANFYGEEAGVTHALKMWSHRVRVKRQGLRNVSSRKRPG
jgi:hypothetical protein